MTQVAVDRNHRLGLRIGGLLLSAAAPAAAQWVNPDTCSWANASCQQANKEKDERNEKDAAFRKEMAEHEARRAKAEQERRRALLKAPPLPAERNELLGSWRLDADGAAFRCPDGSLLQVSLCQGNAAPQASCKLTELQRPGLQLGKLVPRSEIAARVKSCEAGGIRYGADDKPVFVR